MRTVALLVGLVLLTGTARAAEPATIERYFELRDGSVLRLPVLDTTWKAQVLKTDGRLETVSLRLADVQRLALATEPPFVKKRKMLDAVARLGADEYEDREKAQKELVGMGAAIRTDLLQIQDLYTDPEITARLRDVLTALPEDKMPRVQVPFDTFTLREVSWGDAGDAVLSVRVGDRVVRLTRKEVALVSATPLDVTPLSTPRVASALKRLEAKEFPAHCIEEGFEATPDGRKLKIGENIERLFVSKGFLLSTSVKDSFVSVNDFVVHGKSRGLSAATHQPLFTGEITITFVKPGNEHLPAAVTHFGCWIAYVEVNGTELHAYDLQGREIGMIATRQQGHDFLGVQSTVPIHKIRIVPNLKIDPDYTLDDFIYTPPQSPDVAHPEKFVVNLAGGDRVLCRDVSFGPDGLHLEGMPAGLPDFVRPLPSVERIVAPERHAKPPAGGVFVELRDGSILYGAQPAEKDSAPVFARRPQVLRDAEQVVGLWSAKAPHVLWPAAGQKLPAICRVREDRQVEWRPIEQVQLEENGVSWVPGATQGTAPRQKSAYHEVEPLLLRRPTNAGGPGSWHLRTSTGEDVVLSAGELPRLAGSLSRELTTSWDGKELKLPAAEVLSLYRVPKP